MDQKFSFNDVKNILENLNKSILRPECWFCDCFQGFITQIELDSDGDVSGLTDPLIVFISEMHGWLGCDPCPPGEVFSEYIQEKRNKTAQ
ncbi:MAG: hypothetical protein ACFFD2_27185 [Promethearchaeota archaeon]